MERWSIGLEYVGEPVQWWVVRQEGTWIGSAATHHAGLQLMASAIQSHYERLSRLSG